MKDEEKFIVEQNKLVKKIVLSNTFQIDELQYISGVDLAYWSEKNTEYAVCSFVTIDYRTKEVIEVQSSFDRITVPYIPGYLSFRELPLILHTYEKLNIKPDIVIFDGNGYLHYRHMGIATHASFYLNKPTIGVAKSYLKIQNTEFDMPENIENAYTNIKINGEVYGRALRTHKNVKPIFISCGNWIDLETTTQIIIHLIEKDSRQALPTRLADIETKKQRKLLTEH